MFFFRLFSFVFLELVVDVVEECVIELVVLRSVDRCIVYLGVCFSRD